MCRASRRRRSTTCWRPARRVNPSSTNTSTTNRSWCTRSSSCAPTRFCRGNGCGWRRWIPFAGFISGGTRWCSAAPCAAACGGVNLVRSPASYRTQTTRPDVAIRAFRAMAPIVRRCARADARQRRASSPTSTPRILATGLLAAVEGGLSALTDGTRPETHAVGAEHGHRSHSVVSDLTDHPVPDTFRSPAPRPVSSLVGWVRRQRARSPRRQEACTRRVGSLCGRSDLPWWTR